MVVEQFLLHLGRTWAITVMYGTMHPVSSRYVQQVHSVLARLIESEPGNRLLLGVAKDKFLYRDQFLGKGNKVIRNLTERFYLVGIATVIFEQQISAADLLLFLHYLQRINNNDKREAIQADLSRAGVSGIRIFPYHYKELLSRRTAEISKSGKDSVKRGDYLLRSLMTSNFAEQDDEERKIVEEIVKYPELLTAVLKKAAAPDRNRIPEGEDSSLSCEDRISPEVLKRLFHRLGSILVKLPEPERNRIVQSLEAGMEIVGRPNEDGTNGLEFTVAQALTKDRSGEEFLDLLGTILSVENKSGGRFRKIFEVLTVKREHSQPLLPEVDTRAKESLKARDYYSLKTWESVEKLLLDRAEESYVSKDHFRLLESISEGTMETGCTSTPSLPDPGLVASLSLEEQQIRNTEIMLELLTNQSDEENLHDLLEEFRKIVPNLISRKDLSLLRKILLGLSRTSTEIRAECRPAVQEILRNVDYGQLIELAQDKSLHPDRREEIHLLLSCMAAEAIDTLLEHLLSEENRSRRRSLIRMAINMGPPAVPAIQERMNHPKWYFVRNLCTVLGEIGDRSTVPVILGVAGHSDYRVRREAVSALGKLRSPEAVPALGMLLSNEGIFEPGDVVSVRIAAALTLYRIGGTEAESYLHRAMSSRKPAVRDFCRKLITSKEVLR
jgi:hypothetical protein